MEANDSPHDVAVVGMGCRLPGNNNTPEELWRSILQKVDASSEIPRMRWEPYQQNAQNARSIGKVPRRGYFVKNLENFDAGFFNISPKEAEQMDPQQRLVLEVTWEALENAGIPLSSLSGSDAAVFMGVNSDDYGKLLLEDLPHVEPWMGIGTAYCGVANRISYHLNLMGPSTAVDAACASSLVAIHLGRQAILSGESKVAIVGGVNAIFGPGLTSVLDKAGALSSDGRCHSFDDAASGYGRGEGAAVVILKNMAEAVKDGDHILATLKGTAVAQDGRTNGIMAPNQKAQELVARKALDVARVDASTIDYVEAHATSTPVGDPTEVSAISAVYGKGRSPDKPCYIGSVKPNVGHLEAGAGAVGFIKAVMSVQKGILPPQANLKTLNTRVNWSEGVQVVQDIEDWPSSGYPRRAGVCSYGYGGTVSHAIIEKYIQTGPAIYSKEQWPKGTQVLLLSSPQRRSLETQAATQAEWMSTVGKQNDLRCVAATLGTRRSHHKYRAAFVVESHDDAAEKLNAFACQTPTKWTTSGGKPEGDDRPVVWVFSGHGAQWTDMAKDLLQYRVFRDVIESVDILVQKEMGFSAIQAMEMGVLNGSDQVQVLTYLMQIGLSEVLRSLGVSCGAVIGHSVGEIAASVAAGCITPAEGTLIVTRRAKLYRRFMGAGGMALVCAPLEQITIEISTQNVNNLVVAINSSPSSCVVSGPKEEIEAFALNLNNKGIKTIHVDTDIAFHHPMLGELMEPLAEALVGYVSPSQSKVAIYSTSASDPRSTMDRGIRYWLDNMVNPVQLTSAISAAAEDASPLAPIIKKILSMESRGATIQAIAIDISSHDAASQLSSRIDDLCFPPIRGVVHAAGVLHNEHVLSVTPDSFERVLAPKIAGSLTLNMLFPPKTVDFMVLFSSCGQFFGFPGQASYASGNAFLDALATYRRSQGDNTIAMQWTSWREIGMAAGSEFVRAELATKGITDISQEEAFQAWMHVSKYDVDHAVVLRSRALEKHEPLPSPLLVDIAIHKISSILTPPPTPPLSASSDLLPLPRNPADRFDSLSRQVRECVANVLQMETDEVASQEPLSNMGMDSVMTVHLRGRLQKSLGVLVPPNLTWSHPSIDHIVKWLMEKTNDKE
uniref:Cluster 41 polyketide synthase n=1 Tax=Aspergillus flavus (strain ATCC 200026 / FGSC A1120 / IAM 13836 / NRRL 3357 / JCM 12722 / SRRC 167) TaxID=332952 RepID=FLUP_ASPFN|nr:RecName: Full=Cluster 41 polyketide synthase [Aspergillus flavus NRRL3357]